jgi:hypothetical protein
MDGWSSKRSRSTHKTRQFDQGSPESLEASTNGRRAGDGEGPDESSDSAVCGKERQLANKARRDGQRRRGGFEEAREWEERD